MYRRRGARRAARRTVRRTTRRTARRMHRRFRRRRIVVGGFTLLLVGGAAAAGYGAYKLSQGDVQKVEEYTGKPADQLSEEELNDAMDHLGIESHELDDNDVAALESEAEDAPTTSTTAAQSPTPASPGSEDYIAELERLATLRDQGIITPQEFEAKKKQLLGL